MNKDNHWTTIANAIKAAIKTETPITDIPTNLALVTKDYWATIANAHIVRALAQFRIGIEIDERTPITAIETNLALALADVAKALGLSDEDQLEVLGPSAYLAVYHDPIPYTISDNTMEELLAKEQATQPEPPN